MINFIIFFLLITNILLIYLLNKKKIKNIFIRNKIQTINLDQLDDIFLGKQIAKNLLGPKEDVIVKSFCIDQDNKIVGMTSDYEAWIISSLSKISNRIFEFGTCSGKTTYLMALNSSDNARIISITLRPDSLDKIEKLIQDNKKSFRNIINESIYHKFLFSDSIYKKKIKVLFQNSLDFKEDMYINQFDLIFIDGGHTYSVVKNDSEKAFKMLKSNGIILWHDFVPGKETAKNVVKYLNDISYKKNIFHIKNTSLCYFRKI